MDLDETTRTVTSESVIDKMHVEKPSYPVLKGILGSFLGCIPGVFFWVIMGQLGRFAYASGLIMIFGAEVGYSVLTGETVLKSWSALSVVIAFIMPIVSEFIGLGITIYDTFHYEYAITIGDAFRSVPVILTDPSVFKPIITELAIAYAIMVAVVILFKFSKKSEKC